MALINGTSGNDSLVGTSGDDVIYGHRGWDTIVGGDGDDVIYGGTNGASLGLGDKLSGGDGADTFVFVDAAESLSHLAKRDKITDFEASDFIDLSALGISWADVTVTEGAGQYTVSVGALDFAIALLGSVEPVETQFIF